MIDGIYIFYTFLFTELFTIEILITASGYYARNIKTYLKSCFFEYRFFNFVHYLQMKLLTNIYFKILESYLLSFWRFIIW